MQNRTQLGSAQGQRGQPVMNQGFNNQVPQFLNKTGPIKIPHNRMNMTQVV